MHRKHTTILNSVKISAKTNKLFSFQEHYTMGIGQYIHMHGFAKRHKHHSVDKSRHDDSMGQSETHCQYGTKWYTMPAWDKAKMLQAWSKVRHNASKGQSHTVSLCDSETQCNKVTHYADTGQSEIQCQQEAKRNTMPWMDKVNQSLSHWNDLYIYIHTFGCNGTEAWYCDSVGSS